MALRVSISLRDQVAITLEGDDAELLCQVLRTLLRLPMDLVQEYAPGEPAVAEEIVSPPPPAPPPPAPSVPEEITPDAAAQQRFAEFCHRRNPARDMQRVVVATEGAQLYVGMSSVSARELGALFDRAGWPHPSDFVQTLRNSARTTYGWMERVRGKPGYYHVTPKGREEVIGPSAD